MKKLEYDPNLKILKVRFRKNESVDSDVKGNLVLDYDAQGRLVKIDIMDIDMEDFLSIANVTSKKLTIKK